MKDTIEITRFCPKDGARDFEVGFVYVIELLDRLKIGKSRDVEACLASARRWASEAKLLCCWPTIDPLTVERQLHAVFKAFRCHSKHEQFRLPHHLKHALLHLDDYELDYWLIEKQGALDFLTGVKLWRDFTDGLRVWRCHYFLDQHSLCWLHLAHATKPTYQMVRTAYLQNKSAIPVLTMQAFDFGLGITASADHSVPRY